MWVVEVRWRDDSPWSWPPSKPTHSAQPRLMKPPANPHQPSTDPGARGVGTSSGGGRRSNTQLALSSMSSCPRRERGSVGCHLMACSCPATQTPPLPGGLPTPVGGRASAVHVPWPPVATAREGVTVGGFCILTPRDCEPPRGMECGFLIQSPQTWHPPGGQRMWTVEQ